MEFLGEQGGREGGGTREKGSGINITHMQLAISLIEPKKPIGVGGAFPKVRAQKFPYLEKTLEVAPSTKDAAQWQSYLYWGRADAPMC